MDKLTCQTCEHARWERPIETYKVGDDVAGKCEYGPPVFLGIMKKFETGKNEFSFGRVIEQQVFGHTPIGINDRCSQHKPTHD